MVLFGMLCGNNYTFDLVLLPLVISALSIFSLIIGIFFVKLKGKNVMAASNALSCANMALADYEQLIPFDEVVEAMNKVGKAMPHEHCCTGFGGLAITPTAQKIEEGLKNKVSKISC
jgi:Na+/H+-translocating membrane pyrophosphatase